MPPGGSGNLKMIPSMSLHAVKGSEWVDHVIISLGSHLLTVIFQWRPWLVDWRYYLFYIWSYVGFGGVRKGIRPNVTMLQNLLFWGFSCKHVQTKKIGFWDPQGELTWNNSDDVGADDDVEDDDDDDVVRKSPPTRGQTVSNVDVNWDTFPCFFFVRR